MFSNASAKRGFTLIELLVVIAIIALLLSIAVPVFRKVKIQTKMVLCGNNMRQLVVGLTTYANNNDGWFPPNPTMNVDKSSNNYNRPRHRPFELNWHPSTNNPNGGPINPDTFKEEDYVFIGRYMEPYLPAAEVFYCRASDVTDSTEWPPKLSSSTHIGYTDVGTAYREGNFAPLHSTFTLLWGYINTYWSPPYDEYIGPKKLGQKNQLLVQDSLFLLQQQQDNLLWPLPGGYWYSSHWFRGAERRIPYYGKYVGNTAIAEQDPPEVMLNAGYMDGHIDRFNSLDTRLLQNINARFRMTRKNR